MLMHVEAKKDITITGKLTYEEAHQKAVKACDELGVYINKYLTTPDHIACGCQTIGGICELHVSLVKGLLQDEVSRVTVEVKEGGVFRPPSQSGVDELLGKYLDALERMGVH